MTDCITMEQLQEKRRRAKVTADDIATHLGWSRERVSRYLQTPSEEELRQMDAAVSAVAAGRLQQVA